MHEIFEIYGLKFLLDQRHSTIPQHKWVSKLFGYDFSCEFRPGRQNATADALSQRDEESMVVRIMSSPNFTIFAALQNEVSSIPELVALRDHVLGGTAGPDWTVVDGLILHKEHIFVADSSVLWADLLADVHGTGHEGIQKTLHRFRATFFNSGAHKKVREYVKGCVICQKKKKTKHLHPVELLQPLVVPIAIWEDISWTLLKGFPRWVARRLCLWLLIVFPSTTTSFLLVILTPPIQSPTLSSTTLFAYMEFPIPLSVIVILSLPEIFGRSSFTLRVSNFT